MHSLSIRELVDNLINLGYAEAQNMSETDYRALWGNEVTLPDEYIERLDLPLLVDTTMDTDTILDCNHYAIANFYLEGCDTLVPRPVHPQTGAPLTRWIAFLRVENGWKGNVADISALPKDEVGLTLAEGLHFPSQHEDIGRRWSVYMIGSRYGQGYIPRLYWRDHRRPRFIKYPATEHEPNVVRAVRGTYVVPIT